MLCNSIIGSLMASHHLVVCGCRPSFFIEPLTVFVIMRTNGGSLLSSHVSMELCTRRKQRSLFGFILCSGKLALDFLVKGGSSCGLCNTDSSNGKVMG